LVTSRPLGRGNPLGRTGADDFLAGRHGGDHYVHLDCNDYSVHPAAIGRRVQVPAGLEQVRVGLDERLVAENPSGNRGSIFTQH